MFYKPETGQIFRDHSAVRAGLNAMFPEVITAPMLAHNGVFEVSSVDSGVGPDQVAEPATPVLIGGVWRQAWAVRAATAPELAAREAAAREQFKASRTALVAAIVVTVDGMPFDGDEISQSRMARAILAMQAASVPATTWVLANNTPTEVTMAQLQQALIAAGLAQSAVWVAP